jgi:hypothetical protein
VPHIGLTLHTAITFAIALTTLSALLRFVRRRWAAFLSAGAWEAALICLVFALWQVVGGMARTRVKGGISHGYAVWHTERAWHLPSEATLQRLVIPHHTLAHFCNWFYAGAHLNSMWMFLVWMFVRHRSQYTRWRNIVIFSTGMCLLLEMVPVAPPRFLNGIGVIDLPLKYGESVYGYFGSTIADQLSAMPSVHVAWAVLIAYAVITVSPSRWRWLILVHATLTVFVVVVTGNHYWFDGLAAAAFVALGIGLQLALERYASPVLRWRFGWRPSRPEVATSGELHPAGTALAPTNIYAP